MSSSERVSLYLPALILVLLCYFPDAISMASPQQVLAKASQSLVKIETGSSTASGFIWQDAAHAVTALHVVDGQNKITAHYVNANGAITGSTTAVVEKVLIESDLVLLRLLNPQQRQPLVASASMPQAKQTLDALGFPLNISGYSSTQVKVRFGGKQLRSILPPKVVKRLQNAPYPSTSIEILNLEGNLVPGISGGPIVDRHGNLVGIADGGLESGAIGISWGIPANHLSRLANSKVTKTPGAGGVSELFAADLKAEMGQVRQIGGVRLVKLRSRTFAQLADTADDQLALTQLAMTFAMFDPYSFRYDIYQDLDSGATVVVPQGGELDPDDDATWVDFGDERMEMIFQVKRVTSMQQAQNLSLEFENTLTDADMGYMVNLDPSWSYLQPLNLNGVIVNRKAIVRSEFNGFIWSPDAYYFETLAYNGDTLLMAAAVNNDNSPEMVQAEALCIQQGMSLPSCMRLFESRRIWAQIVLGVQFASFPAAGQ